jgi:hypothetical protein
MSLHIIHSKYSAVLNEIARAQRWCVPDVHEFGGQFAPFAAGKGRSTHNATYNHKESVFVVSSFIRLAICGMWQERYSYIADSARSASQYAGPDAYAGANARTDAAGRRSTDRHHHGTSREPGPQWRW